jgi:hypothetical protein
MTRTAVDSILELEGQVFLMVKSGGVSSAEWGVVAGSASMTVATQLKGVKVGCFPSTVPSYCVVRPNKIVRRTSGRPNDLDEVAGSAVDAFFPGRLTYFGKGTPGRLIRGLPEA